MLTLIVWLPTVVFVDRRVRIVDGEAEIGGKRRTDWILIATVPLT